MIFSFIFPVYAQGDTLDNSQDIGMDLAYKIAVTHVIGDMKLSDETFKDKIRVYKTTELYDFDGNQSAYLFEFSDESNNSSGYIIVAANENYAPIIEYSYEGEPFINKAIDEITGKDKSFKEKDKTVYYTGKLNYFIGEKGKKDEAYDITSDKAKKVKVKDIKSDFTSKLKDNSKEWKQWRDIVEYTNGSVPTPPIGTYITNPSDHESGYEYIAYKDITGYNQVYKTTSDFRGYTNHCGPTAGTNLMIYWYNRDSNKFGRLYKNNNWNDVFYELYVNMRTAQYNTTYDTDFDNAIYDYFNKYANGVGGIPVKLPSFFSPRLFFRNFETIDQDTLRANILDNCPPVLLLQKHKLYGNHYVLALGYRRYFYKLSSLGIPFFSSDIEVPSTYIRIADGWTSSPVRFVHAGIGYDSGGGVLMQSVYPY